MSWNTQPGARLGNGLRWWALPWPKRHLGPRSPWRPPGVAASLNTCPVPNSTQVRASTSECSVALYRSASALPVEHPGIGVGACGTMASYYGYFEGHAYPGAVAALGTLRLPAPTCPHKSGVPLAAGVVATLYSGPLPEDQSSPYTSSAPVRPPMGKRWTFRTPWALARSPLSTYTA